MNLISEFSLYISLFSSNSSFGMTWVLGVLLPNLYQPLDGSNTSSYFNIIKYYIYVVTVANIGINFNLV